LILTGARLREILRAKWEHVDFERGLLSLQDSKTGKKPVYLSTAALAVLSTLQRIAGNPYIVPGEQNGTPRADLKRPWAAVTKAAGLDGLRLHDMRHSFASFGAGASLGLPIIGKLLGHCQARFRKPGITLFPRRGATRITAEEVLHWFDEAAKGRDGRKRLPIPELE
jgi:integrase